MVSLSERNYQLALRDFQHARREAVMQQVLASVQGKADELLCFDDVRKQLRSTGEPIRRGLQEIPLAKIIGSVARYDDFTRSFLPKNDSDEERWAHVRAAVQNMAGMPPIEVYQVGEVYFVLDGNHRVSIARQLRTKTISAYVTEIKTRVPLTADDDPRELICKAHFADFLEKTNIDKLRPDSNLQLTFCDQYPLLLEQIEAEYQYLRKDNQELSEEELRKRAVEDWYDHVYQPVVQLISEVGVLHRFPSRTETDMYILLSERRAELEKALGWNVDMETGVTELINQPEKEPFQAFRRIATKISPFLDKGPRPGLWRKQQMARDRYHHLFEHILVPLDGTEENWKTFEYILEAAQFDGDHLHGLHVVNTETAVQSEEVETMRARFELACRKASINAEFAVEVGNDPIASIIKHAAWVDFVMLTANRPPEDRPLPRISADLKTIIQQCPRPMQVRPIGAEYDYKRALLAYDGSPKADEALFIATYMAGRWKKSLSVVTVETAHTGEKALKKAREYLVDHRIKNVHYELRKGPIAETVLDVAKEQEATRLFMGGFSFNPLRHLMLGSTAEHILRAYSHPMWICG